MNINEKVNETFLSLEIKHLLMFVNLLKAIRRYNSTHLMAGANLVSEAEINWCKGTKVEFGSSVVYFIGSER